MIVVKTRDLVLLLNSNLLSTCGGSEHHVGGFAPSKAPIRESNLSLLIGISGV